MLVVMPRGARSEIAMSASSSEGRRRMKRPA